MWRSRVLYAAVTTVVAASVPLWSSSPGPAQIPETPGWELIVGRCLPCHSLEIAVQQRQGPQGWAAILDRMIGYGAPIPPEDRQPVLEYLLRHYRDPDGR